MGNPISSRGSHASRIGRLPSRMDWWHFFVVVGMLTTIFNVVWLNAAGGVLFGVGMTWWVVGGAYDHRIQDWLFG